VKVYFIRHGQTDWGLLERRGVRGWARSFAPLTPLGRLQMETIARDFRLQEAEVVLCSSYTRALESAARLNQVLGKPLYVEYDLHEWLPQKDSLAEVDEAVIARANRELSYYTGVITFPDRRAPRQSSPYPLERERRRPAEARQVPPPEERSWESLEEVRARVTGVLKRYGRCQTIAVVTHAVVIASFIGLQRPVDFAAIMPYDLELTDSLSEVA